MKIAVVAASGKAGREVVKEAKNRGFEVTAFVRNQTEVEGADKVVIKGILDLTKEDLAGFDAVVDAFGAWTEETLPEHSTTLMHLCDILDGSNTRLLVVGGAGSLFVNKEHTVALSETEGFPDIYLPVANAMGKGLKELRKRNGVKWTYISPAGDFRADGERKGEYLLAGEEFTLNEKGESVISYADYAIAMVDEMEKGNHVNQRISVLWK